jgi:hypothetical protein
MLAQHLGGAAGGNNFDARGREGLGKRNQARLVKDGQQSALDFGHIERG